MHCVLEGVANWLLKAWFDPRFHSQPFSVRRSLNSVDRMFMNQRPPHEFSRPPRSIKSHLAYWKESEFRSWILFYSLPLLLHVLPPLYFHHFALLVCAIHILLNVHSLIHLPYFVLLFGLTLPSLLKYEREPHKFDTLNSEFCRTTIIFTEHQTVSFSNLICS